MPRVGGDGRRGPPRPLPSGGCREGGVGRSTGVNVGLVGVARARRFLLALVAVGLLAAACAEAPAAQAAPTGPPAPTVSPTLPPALAAALRDPAPRAATEPGALAEQIAVAESTVTDPTRPP